MIMTRESIEWCQHYWFNTENPDNPRILLIGDSIVVGHREKVADALKGIAVVGAFSSSKFVSDPAFYRELMLALADYPIDYIYFNNGLHGLTSSDGEYRRGLEELIQFLRTNTRARLYWRSSTPITVAGSPEKLDEAQNAVVIRRNRIAQEVMVKHHIPTDDLYAVMLNHPEYSAKDGFHYNDVGVAAQVEHIAAFLKEAFASRHLFCRMNGFETDFPGFVSDWHGYESYSFKLNGIWCRLIKPNVKSDPKKHWYWRVHFFGAFPHADFALLDRGWYVTHIDVHELYGSAECMRRMDMLYKFMTSLGFDPKCVPVGYSRGGLDVYNWAVNNTEKVYCLYLDNPVCDFKSWPGGRGASGNWPTEWQNCLNAWHFTEAEALSYQLNPVDNLAPLAQAGVPILHLCGDADEVVPPEENTRIVEKRYRELGGNIEVIYKPGAGHHPHCLENPQPIVDFILKYVK